MGNWGDKYRYKADELEQKAERLLREAAQHDQLAARAEREADALEARARHTPAPARSRVPEDFGAASAGSIAARRVSQNPVARVEDEREARMGRMQHYLAKAEAAPESYKQEIRERYNIRSPEEVAPAARPAPPPRPPSPAVVFPSTSPWSPETLIPDWSPELRQHYRAHYAFDPLYDGGRYRRLKGPREAWPAAEDYLQDPNHCVGFKKPIHATWLDAAAERIDFDDTCRILWFRKHPEAEQALGPRANGYFIAQWLNARIAESPDASWDPWERWAGENAGNQAYWIRQDCERDEWLHLLGQRGDVTLQPGPCPAVEPWTEQDAEVIPPLPAFLREWRHVSVAIKYQNVVTALWNKFVQEVPECHVELPAGATFLELASWLEKRVASGATVSVATRDLVQQCVRDQFFAKHEERDARAREILEEEGDAARDFLVPRLPLATPTRPAESSGLFSRLRNFFRS